METITLPANIRVFYITADSFPEGIMTAHQKICALLPSSEDRNHYGISRPENGTIVYKAAVTALSPGEAAAYNCEAMELKKGNYSSVTIHNYQKDLEQIRRVFEELLKQPGIDPNGYCVEWYTGDKDVICMVRLAR